MNYAINHDENNSGIVKSTKLLQHISCSTILKPQKIQIATETTTTTTPVLLGLSSTVKEVGSL